MLYQQNRVVTRYILLLSLLTVLLTGCQKEEDPDPIPETGRYYVNMYNFMVEPFEVQWNIRGLNLELPQAYRVPLLSFFPLEEASETAEFRALEWGTERLIQSDTCTVEQNNYYLACLMGSREDSVLLLEALDLDPPSLGKIKLRFMHTAMELGPVDVYIGGSSAEHKLVSGLSFSEISNYIEASEEALWESLIITPANSSPAEMTLFSFLANDIFETGQVYMGVVGHKTNSPSSDLQFFLYEHPVGL